MEMISEDLASSTRIIEDTWLYHKPVGLICTRNDPRGRPTIWRDLSHLPPPFQAVGRLDKDSCGLLLITRNGELAQHLLNPCDGVEKIYEVKAMGMWSKQKEELLRSGVEMARGGQGRADTLRAQECGTVVDLSLALRHGKKREIRYSLAALGLQVLALQRVKCAGLWLGDLPVGQSRPLSPQEEELLWSNP